MPPLQRYAVAGWTARELHAHLDRLIASRGWTVPGRPAELIERDSGGQVRVRVRKATTMKSPYGYLAFLLRQIDPTDLATDQAYDAALRATEHYQRQLIYGSPCPHGQPAGDIPLPTKGIAPARCAAAKHHQTRLERIAGNHARDYVLTYLRSRGARVAAVAARSYVETAYGDRLR